MTNRRSVWRLYTIAKATNSRPSSIINIHDEWAAFQFDAAICTIGIAIENAAQERVNVGNDDEPNWQLRYKMTELLDPKFKLPTEDSWVTDEELALMDGIMYDEVK